MTASTERCHKALAARSFEGLRAWIALPGAAADGGTPQLPFFPRLVHDEIPRGGLSPEEQRARSVVGKISFEAVKKFEYGRISSLFERI